MEKLITQIKALGTGAATLIIALALVSLGALSWTDVHAQAVGVANTPHNLGSTGGGPNTFSGTADVCVFCHTPHGGDTGAAVPLWNRALSAPTAYSTYQTLSSATIDGAIVDTGSVSIACLSCHDGTQAMDTLANDPGSGTATFGAGDVWTGNDRPQGIANLGTDLRNDHPIGIQYGGGGVTVTTLSGADQDFNPTVTADLNGTQVWWVNTNTTGSTPGREKTDMLLYTRTDLVPAGEPFVECASCHDPHTDQNALFMRIDNAGSAVCQACHTK